jgi:hypothetical protein
MVDTATILIILNMGLTVIAPVLLCITRIRKSKCCGHEMEITESEPLSSEKKV